MIHIGIDPGKSGAYAILEDGKAPIVEPWSESGFVQAMGALPIKEIAMAMVEKVGAMPGQGVTSMFHFGKNAGFIEGVLSAYRIPHQLVPPQRWKKEFSLGSDKEQSISACRALFPDANLLPTPRCRKPNDGMAEALLIAEYGRRQWHD